MTTKIHAACVDEISSVSLALSPGQSADCSHFAEPYAALDEDNVLEAAALDKGYDTNAIREFLAQDGIEPVIPSKSNRKEAIPHDEEIYRERNRVERFFNRLKHFRADCDAIRKVCLHFPGNDPPHRRIPVCEIN